MSSFLLKLGDMRFPVRLGETLIGRSPYCSLVLSDTRVSRQHAAIRLGAEGLLIEDLGSRNGTQLNGKPLRGRSPLAPGDIIQMGDQRIEIERAASPVQPGRPPLADTGDYTLAKLDAESPTEPGKSPAKGPARLTPHGTPRPGLSRATD